MTMSETERGLKHKRRYLRQALPLAISNHLGRYPWSTVASGGGVGKRGYVALGSGGIARRRSGCVLQTPLTSPSDIAHPNM